MDFMRQGSRIDAKEDIVYINSRETLTFQPTLLLLLSAQGENSTRSNEKILPDPGVDNHVLRLCKGNATSPKSPNVFYAEPGIN